MAAARTKSQSGMGTLLETLLIVGVAVGLALLIQAFLVKPFRIPTESMEPTLDVGQRVLANRLSARFSNPDRGDVVVFKPPAGADEDPSCGVPQPSDQPCPRPTRSRSDNNFIKRVVAVPGDRLKVIDGHVYLNGRQRREPFVRPDGECPTCDLPREITIPPGHFFMMGDNRGESADSREWGPVPEEWIIGSAFFTYWPPREVGPL